MEIWSESSKTINPRLLLIESSKALAMPESSETRAMPESFKTVQCPNPPKPCNARILPPQASWEALSSLPGGLGREAWGGRIIYYFLADLKSAGLPGGLKEPPGRLGAGGFGHYTVWEDSGITRFGRIRALHGFEGFRHCTCLGGFRHCKSLGGFN